MKRGIGAGYNKILRSKTSYNKKMIGTKEVGILGYSMKNIRNQNEELAAGQVAKVLGDDQTVCKCPLCVEDIFCIVLNSLPGKYKNAFSIRLKKDLPTDKDLEQVIRKAIQTVTQHPKHSVGD